MLNKSGIRRQFGLVGLIMVILFTLLLSCGDGGGGGDDDDGDDNKYSITGTWHISEFPNPDEDSGEFVFKTDGSFTSSFY